MKSAPSLAVVWLAMIAFASAADSPAPARDAVGNTPLHLAALNHDLAAVRVQLAAGAEVDAKNAAEATPLLYGAGHAEIVRALLARGANPNAPSKDKDTPLMAAVSHAVSCMALILRMNISSNLRKNLFSSMG